MKKFDPSLYFITDSPNYTEEEFLYRVERALQGGVTLLQLREKEMDEATFVEEALKVREICQRYQVPLIINDNVNVALKCGADGVHVGIEDTPVAEIRKKAGSDFIIGATAKTVEQARRAEREGADYLGVGAVFPSSTKENALRITTGQLKEICSSVSIPAVAIGGLNFENMEVLTGSGIHGVALVSAIFAAEDIKMTAEQYKKKVKMLIKK